MATEGKRQIDRTGDYDIEQDVRNMIACCGKHFLRIAEDHVFYTAHAETLPTKREEQNTDESGSSRANKLTFWLVARLASISSRLFGVCVAVKARQDAACFLVPAIPASQRGLSGTTSIPRKNKRDGIAVDAKHPAPRNLAIP